jgi:transposase InsO family protein
VVFPDSGHDGPIFPNLGRDIMLDGPNQLWVADLTHIAIAAGFVYLAAILDAWSRRVVGWLDWLDGQTRKPLRQFQGREFYEDAEGRSRLPDGIQTFAKT